MDKKWLLRVCLSIVILLPIVVSPRVSYSIVDKEQMHEMGSVVEETVDSIEADEHKVETAFSWGGYFQAIGIMCLFLALLWGAVWGVRRYGKFNFVPSSEDLPKGALKMEAQLPLGAKKGLVIVRFLDRRILLGITEQNIVLLKDTGLHDERDAQEFEALLNGVGQHDSETV